MYPEVNAKGSQPCAVRKKPNDQHINPISSLAADGFDIWWQKTFAQHSAMASEASALMRTHRRLSSANHARVGKTH
jgi:hypothetical protein